MTRPRPQELVD